MSRAAKATLALLLVFAALLLAAAGPDWSDPEDLNAGSGPENSGRYYILFYFVPAMLLLALAVWRLRGVLQKIAIGAGLVLCSFWFVGVVVVTLAWLFPR